MAKAKSEKKIYVLDTSVILYDHKAIKNFKDNDIALPLPVLEELDNFKKGNDTKNFEARSFIRSIDEMSRDYLLNDWVPLGDEGKGKFKVVMKENLNGVDAVKSFGDEKNDNKILNAALTMKHENPDTKVVLVSKDICLRMKAKALKLNAEDYETGKVKNVDSLYTGKTVISGVDDKIIDELFKDELIDYTDLGLKEKPRDNHYFILKGNRKSILAYYNPEIKKIERIEKTIAYGIMPKNAEQAFAMHALMNPNIKLVTMQGVAGSGKTLLAMACAIEQRSQFRQVYVSRPIIPLSNRDIGFLPGDVKSKLDPYMQPIWDNLRYIKNQFSESDKNAKKIDQLIEENKIEIAPLAYIRGRSIANVFFVIDEAQNLTPHEIKTIISRAGENTKVIFTGDIHQIDTPYLDSESNGLSYLIDKVKDNHLFAHITLEKGERSELANLANDFL